MKKWDNPEVVELDIMYTELGRAMTPYKDDDYVDENQNHWYSFSGESEAR